MEKVRRITIPQPQPKQLEFMAAKSRYVCYGGAKGGGKSWSVRYKALLMAINYPGITILITRATYSELYNNHIREIVSMSAGIGKYNSSRKEINYFNGSLIKFGYVQDSAMTIYQGQECDVLFVDEATNISKDAFEKLKLVVRGVNDFPKRTYLTCNPGGKGHTWVRDEFVKNVNGEEGRIFIPAKVYDNPALMQSTPEYVSELESLPDGIRQMLLDGDWDSFAGQYFTMWSADAHVIAPFPLPEHWRRYRAIDYGLDMLACLWIAVDESGNAYVYKELHESDLIVSDAARRIKEVNGADKIYTTYAPVDLWSRTKDSGKTVAEIFQTNGCDMVKSDVSRVPGWFALSEWLKVSDGGAKLRIFSNCRKLIEYLPQMQRDEKDPCDCATEPHDITHICDALRYFAVMHDVKSPAIKKPKTETDRIKKQREETNAVWRYI
jgi:phage terminase large subunit